LSATEAKNEFGHVLEQAIQGNAIVITKHDAPKAVLISIDEYVALSRADQVQIQTLSEEFDALLEEMQTSRARRGMRAAFNASPEQIGRAAVAAAAKLGRQG
jgi:antitoxin Phd